MSIGAWVDSLGLGSIAPAVVALGTPAGTLVALWKFGLLRADARKDAEARAEQASRQWLDTQRVALSADQTAAYDRLQSAYERKCAELDRVETDRDRGWDLARFWFGKAHEMLQLYSTLRHAAMALIYWARDVRRRRPEESEQPDLSDVMPGPITLPASLEEPIPRRAP